MISPETRVQIRRYFYAEHWKIGTIATALDVHPDTVRRAIEVERFQHAEPLRPSILDPYLPFVREVLEQHPRLRATRIHHMIRDRGYTGSVEQLRRVVARLRPQPHEAFLRLQVFPAEHYGEFRVMVRNASRVARVSGRPVGFALRAFHNAERRRYRSSPISLRERKLRCFHNGSLVTIASGTERPYTSNASIKSEAVF